MKKNSHQIKSRWYYIFWGSMAVAVVGGQIYVGLGYRQMARAQLEGITPRVIVECVPEYKTPPPLKQNKPLEFE